VVLGCDNVATVSWIQRGSTTSHAAPAYLLHSLANIRRQLPFTLNMLYTPGVTNTLADCCSRSFHMSNTAFLDHVNAAFPRQPSWQLVTPPTALLSNMNSALSRTLPPRALPPHDKPPRVPCGTSGLTSAFNCTSTPTYPKSRTLYPYSKYLPTDTAMGSWLPATLRCELERWKAPFAPLDRASPHWACPTLDSNRQENSTYDCLGNFQPTKNRTPPPPVSSLSHFQSWRTQWPSPALPIHQQLPRLPTCSSSGSSFYYAPGNMPTPTTLTRPPSACVMCTY
jgi:hypothetical protein